MAPIIQEPEILFAQSLASNEKTIRTKALKKLRKYITVRSQKSKDAFTGDELLKIWKGLFYCLWMQDKVLLQEDLSHQISRLIHSFQNVDTRFLFVETFLQTIKREWNGIDRLRMDKFFQLVRFMFRQVFEMLKVNGWDSSLVARFLEIIAAQVLHSTSGTPSGIQFHILDLYTAELAGVGSAELTADQNLTLIDPFCRTAAKTKDRVLLQAICSKLFHAIVTEAPFAIEDLMKEIQKGGAEDSCPSSEEEEGEEPQSKRTNGTAEEEEDEVSVEREEELAEQPDDEDIGPVLQFDYSALADRLFELASRANTPSFNRKKLYNMVKTFRNLSQGVFPQDEYPEDVSTDEDDDMFASRKRMKKRRRHQEEEEGSSPTKKRKAGKSSEPERSGSASQTSAAPADATGGKKQKKRRKKKKRTGKSGEPKGAGGAEGGEKGEDPQAGAGVPGEPEEKRAESVEGPGEAVVQLQSSTKKKKKILRSSSQDSEGIQSEEADDEGKAEPSAAKTQRAEAGERGDGLGTPTGSGAKKRARRRSRQQGAQVTVDSGEAQAHPDATLPQTSDVEGPQAGDAVVTAAQKKATKKRRKIEQTEDRVASEDAQPQTDAGCADEQPEPVNAGLPALSKKKKKRKAAPADGGRVEEVEGHPQLDTSAEQSMDGGSATPGQKGALKRREQEQDDSFQINGHAEEQTEGKVTLNVIPSTTKRTPPSPQNVEEPSTPATLKKVKAKGLDASEFVTFQTRARIPTPIFYKKPKAHTHLTASTPTSKRQTPKSESKKVTFGLGNNRTAEFRKSDRSLLVSPSGSSRVPFDPQQKPPFGVLKSPVVPGSSSKKKVKSTPTRRPTAADFF